MWVSRNKSLLGAFSGFSVTCYHSCAKTCFFTLLAKMKNGAGSCGQEESIYLS